MDPQQLQNRINALEQDFNLFKQKYAIHQHTNTDGTNHLRKNIILDRDQFMVVGLGSQATAPILSEGTTSEQLQYFINVGKDSRNTSLVQKADLLQMNFLHLPRNTSLQSFITSFRTPIVTSVEGTSISTTVAGNTVTISGFNFVTDELAGALIDIFNSSGTLIETQTIASNTATVVTISGTWLASTGSAKFQIYAPVFLGSADTIWQRFYTQEGTAGGIRFGVGPTAGGQNGLLYMDSAGDLYWRNKSGSSVKLN